MRRIAILALFAVIAGSGGVKAAPSESATAPDPSFRNDVMAVLSQAGCNAGGCHGNKNGKGGFKLSLRGQDPDLDYAALTRDLFARRTNPIEPPRSLILLKATGVTPHEGGARFNTESLDYKILRRWIESGTPQDADTVPTLQRLEVTPSTGVLVEPVNQVQIKATAVFSDGTRRDVSSLAVYEQSTDLAKVSSDGLVRRQRDGETTVIVRYLQRQQPVRLAFVPARPGFKWQHVAGSGYIDEQIFAKLQTLRINPSAVSGDQEFVRRAYLDILGLVPTAEEAQQFVTDPTPGKRSQLIDRLLGRPEYADFWAMKWSDVLRNEERTLDRKGVQNFHRWIRQSVAENKPLDQFVSQLLAGRGSTYTNPPSNYYRANRDPVTRGEATAELFLGIRLQCAQCHNHPFDRWTQDDYYSWADVFARVEYKILENRRTDDNDKHEFVGEQIVYEAATGDVKDPRDDRQVKPRLLGTAKALPADADRLDALASWVTSPKNPFFAKAQVNRIWFHLMGRGLVDPVDDFRPTNPASHPELLDLLSKDFVAHGYDVKYLIRLITGSTAYGLSSDPNDTNADDEVNYSHNVPRRLTAEQLLDAQHQVAAVPAEFTGYPKGIRAGQLPGVKAAKPRLQRPSQADVFLVTFGKPARLLVCDCERSSDTTLGQTFQLISGPEMVNLLSSPENRLSRFIKDGVSDESAVEELYWTALARPPVEAEKAKLVEHIRAAADRRRGLEDVVWALLNSKEFVLRR